MSLPSDEKSNVKLRHIVLESQYQDVLDAVTKLTAETLDAPLVLITFVDDSTFWIHSEVGYTDVKVLPNNGMFCGIYPKDDQFYEIYNTDLDSVHRHHLFHINDVKVKYYAAARIKLPLGEMIAVLCVFDVKSRMLDKKQRNFLIGLAKVVEKLLVTKNFYQRIS